MKYILYLGKSIELAKQEIFSIFEENIVSEGDNFFIVDTDWPSAKMISTLAGTVKVVRYLDEVDSIEQIDVNKWESFLLKHIAKNEKLNFGFSLYFGNKKEYSELKKTALKLKAKIKGDKKIRLVTGKESALSSVIVAKNDLLDKELIVIKHKDKYLVGITEQVQDFEGYAHRDIDRPAKDSRSGMLPPKIARMMINIANSEKNNILDAFCGSGTVLTEAACLGYKKIYGSDMSKKAVEDTKSNLEWVQGEYDLNFGEKVILADVKNVSNKFTEKIDLIVSEPFMGNAREIVRETKVSNLLRVKEELQKIYYDAFREFHKMLGTEGQVVFVFPVFQLGRDVLATIDTPQIESLGFRATRLKYKSKNSDNGILYSREGQKVIREITLWEKI